MRAGGAPAAKGRFVARAELVLSRPANHPLREVPLRPEDPLGRFAQAFGELRLDLDEDARVVIDLLPMSPGRSRRERRRIARMSRAPLTASRLDPSRGRGRDQGSMPEIAHELELPGQVGAGDTVLYRREVRALGDKLRPGALFSTQILLWVASKDPDRPARLLQGLLAGFEQFGGADNHFKVSGLNLLGLKFVGSDSALRAPWFDLRMRSGLHLPARRNLLATWEIAGLLKPPSRHCAADNVARAGAIVPAPPRDLPRYEKRADGTRPRNVLPLGRVMSPDGPVHVGMYEKDFFFGYASGRSRFGKTESALGIFTDRTVIGGYGGTFLDPHGDAITRLLPFLTAEGVRERVRLVDCGLTQPYQRHVAWNPFSLVGLTAQNLPQRASALVDAITVAAGWHKGTGRSLAIATQTINALLQLALILPHELSPTMWTIPRLLQDEEFRGIVTAVLPDQERRFWTDTFSRMPTDAVTPFVQLVERLGAHPGIRAVLGSPISTYSARQAMDRGHIVLLYPGGSRQWLMANFLVQDLLQAALSRVELAKEKRRVHYTVLDEVQAYDGATSGTIPALLEETAKYGMRVLILNQNPDRITPDTQTAITTNSSLLMTTGNNAEAAQFFNRQWGSQGIDATKLVPNIDQYSYVAQIMHGRRRTKPFRLAGVAVDEIFADLARPEMIAELEAAVDASCRPRTIGQTLAALDGSSDPDGHSHDEKILRHLARRVGSRARLAREEEAAVARYMPTTPTPHPAASGHRGLALGAEPGAGR